MTKELIPTLISDLASASLSNLTRSPELLALTALDANLFSVINLLETDLPYLGQWPASVLPERYDYDDYIAEAILMHAQILRKNLAAYYLILRDRQKLEDQEIIF